MAGILRRIRNRLRRSDRLRHDLNDEIRTHLELRTRDLVKSGMQPEQARREAERRFGDLADARERLYASARRSEGRLRLAHWLDSLRQDLLVGLRRIRASPAFSALSIATFALGIGLTTTMFAIVDAAVLRPLPFPEPERLYALWSVPEEGQAFPWVSATNWLDWKEQNHTLAGTALYAHDRVSFGGLEENVRLPSANVGGAFFEVLRAPMLLGRPFSEQEADDREPVIVVSERFWRRFLGADAELGEVVVGGVSRRVVGVVAERHAFPGGTDVWQPAIYRRLSGAARNNINWFTIARLAPGVSSDQARGDLDRVAGTIREQEPEAVYSWGVAVVPLHEVVVGDAEEPLRLLGGAVAFVLLVACANLAGQAYARSLSNVQGAAVRLALGATRARVLQHQIVEHLLLGCTGGLVGLALTYAAAGWLARRGLPLPRAHTIAVDPRVMAFAIAVSLLAGLLAGLAPALRVARSAPRAAMGSVRGAASGTGINAAKMLVAAEVALSVLLLIGGGVLGRSFADFVARDLGYRPDGILSAEVELAGPTYRDFESRLAFWDRFAREMRAMSGVQSAAITREVPGTDRSGYGWIELSDRPELEDAGATYRVVSEDYFTTLALPLLTGRDFTSSDDLDTDRVVIVSRRFAELYWPGESPLGKRFRAPSMESGLGAPELTVIGIVADLDNGTGMESRPAMYVLYRQVPFWADLLGVVARVEPGNPLALAGAVRERLRTIDDSLAADIGTVTGHLGEILARDRLVMAILNGFAILAVGLAAIGVHGLISFSVNRRTREIAVRSALGADRPRILRMVLGSAVRLAVAGAAAGVAAAWALSGYLRSQIIGVTADDPLIFGAVVVVLIAVTVGAAWLPAWRAVRLDPCVALRVD